MRALFLDLANHNGLLACVTEERVTASASVDRRIDDATLALLLEELMHRAGWTFGDLDRIACVVGPGGFTSLRVTVAAANTIAWVLDIPSAGIHLSDLYASRFPKSESRIPNPESCLPAGRSRIPNPESRIPNVWWLHSTRKAELFVRGFGKHAASVPEAQLFTLEEFLPTPESGSCWTGELIAEHHILIEERGIMPVVLQPLSAILPTLLLAQSYKEQILKPWYGRGW